MLSLSDNPPVTPVADAGRSVFDDTGRAHWVALYTRPRQEKALASELLHLGVDYFLPMVTRLRVSGGRRRTTLHPLFPSYVFADVGDSRRLSVLRTDRVLQTISPEPSQRERFHQEMRAIEAAILAYPERIELQPRVVQGAPVRVTGGAMRGTEGVVVKLANRSKIWLEVKTLGTGVLLEIECDLLEPTA